jgi:hypothetical protein
LSVQQSRDFAATIADGLGRADPDSPFELGLFNRQMRKFSPSARETIFGPSGAASIDNLLLLSRRLQRAQSEINTSKNARSIGSVMRSKAADVVTAMLGTGGFMAGGPAGGAGGVAAGIALKAGGSAIAGAQRVVSAKTLMNPQVSRWMADAVEVNSPQKARSMVRRLGAIIERDPSLSGELQPVYDALQQRLTLPLAAQGEGQQHDQ